MPAVIVAVAAAAAASAATAGAASLIGATLLGSTLLATAAASLVGAVIATGVGYGLNSLLGTQAQKKSTAAAAQERKQLIRSSVEPRQVIFGRTIASGPMVYATSSGRDQRYLHLVIPLATHACDGIDEIKINDTVIPAANINGAGYVTEGFFASFLDFPGGSPIIRARFYNGTQTTADPDLVAESPDGWSANHVLQGVAYLYVRLAFNPDAFPNGLQNISAVVRGNSNVYDPRISGRYYTNNPALCALEYLRADYGLACDDDEIDFDSFVTAANICDEQVQKDSDGNTHARYAIDGSFKLDASPMQIMEDILSCCGGTIVYVQGQYRLYVGAYDTPTDTLTVSDLAGDVELITKPPRRDLFNSVRGTFIDPARSWQAAEFQPYAEDEFLTDDGEAIWKDFDLPFTTNNLRAVRLAKLALRRSRESLTLRAPVQYRGIRYAVWQTLSVTMDDFGWTSKPFRVLAFTFDPMTNIVTLTLREESAASYAFDFNDWNGEGSAPDTSLVDAFTIPAPAGLTQTEELYSAADGAGVRTRAVLAWVAPSHPFTTGYDAQFRRVGVDAWSSATVSLGDTTASINDMSDGDYDFRVRARSIVAVGAWATVRGQIGRLAQVSPVAITGFALQAIGGFAFLRWDQHADLDVRAGGRIEIRHTPDTVSPSWVGATSIGDAVPGNGTMAIVPLKAGTYFAKAVDAGGRYATTAAFIGASQASALTFANVDTLTEDPGFSGAKTDTVVTSSKLTLDTSGDVDAEADFDAIASLDGLGGVKPSGSYAFSGGMDLGAVMNVRVTAALEAMVVNTLDQVDERAALVDDWADFDGTVGGEADAWVETRTTQDNPAGSPTWDDWRRVDAAEFSARGFEFRAQLRSSDPAFNIEVSALSATADEVV